MYPWRLFRLGHFKIAPSNQSNLRANYNVLSPVYSKLWMSYRMFQKWHTSSVCCAWDRYEWVEPDVWHCVIPIGEKLQKCPQLPISVSYRGSCWWVTQRKRMRISVGLNWGGRAYWANFITAPSKLLLTCGSRFMKHSIYTVKGNVNCQKDPRTEQRSHKTG